MVDKYAVARRVARNHANHLSLNSEEQEECAQKFVIWVFQKEVGDPAFFKLLTDQPALFHRCAFQYALGHKRYILRHSMHKVSLEYLNEGYDLERNLPEEHGSVESNIFQKETYSEFRIALDTLTDQDRECFVRHHHLGEQINEIAESLNKKPNAIYQSLHRARRNIAADFLKRGITEEYLRDFLAPTPPPAIGREKETKISMSIEPKNNIEIFLANSVRFSDVAAVYEYRATHSCKEIRFID